MASAASPLADAAYNGPAGTTNVVPVGTATYQFLTTPYRFQMWEFLGIAFIVFVLARHWGKFVNRL